MIEYPPASFISNLPDETMSVEVYHTRRFLGSRVIEKDGGGIKSTTTESLLYGFLRQTGKVATKIGRDSVEVARTLKEFLKIDTVQNIGGLFLVYLAYLNQEVELPPMQSGLLPHTQETQQPPVETQVSPEKAAITQPFSYVIQRGDTLFSIARKSGVSVEALIQANPWIENRNLIHAGQELIIPGVTSPETPVKDEYRTIVGIPTTYKMTEKDISFLNWLNSAHLNWRDWNGYKQRIYIPDWIYQLAKTAEVASNGRCSRNQLVGVGLTETGYFKGSQWDPETVSYANAKGVMQFVPGTFKVHAPYEGADPYDPKDNMIAACNKIVFQRLTDETTQIGWAENFLGNGPTGAMWNGHKSQANNSWLLFQTLEEYERIFNGMYETTVNE